MNNYNIYSRGSEWRKWDLHAHTPIDHEWINRPNLTTIQLKKQFAKNYIAFAKKKNLEVIAITDHNFCNDINELLIPYIIEEADKNSISILPGFELTASDGSGVHLLVIFEKGTDIQKIDRIVSHFFRPNVNRIVSNGNVCISNKNIDEIKNTLDDSGEDYLLVFAHADRENGVLDSGTITGQRRIEEWHKDYIKICQLAKPITEYTSGFIYNVINGNDINYRKDMTYIIASDCRTIEENNNREERFYLGEKAVWIKSDPNLQGLKQIIYEPSRVYFGDEPPSKTEKNKIIDSIKISNSNGWFQDEKINFNEGQISIIGGKGTGKTAILDLIAYATNSLNIKDKNCFINRAHKEIMGTKIEVYWKSGQKDEIDLTDRLIEPLPLKKQKIKYLTQSFVEELCDYMHVDNLTNQIENIIFQNLPPAKKSEYLDFTEYKADVMKVLHSQKERCKKNINTYNQNLSKMIDVIEKEQDIKKQKLKIDNDIKELQKEYKKLKKRETKSETQDIQKIDSLNEKIIAKENLIGNLNKKILLKDEVLNDIQVFKEESNDFITELKKKLKELGLNKRTIDKVQVSLLPSNLNTLIVQLAQKITDKTKNENILLEEINKSLIQITRNLKLEESRKDKINEINKKLNEYSKKRENLLKELKKIEEYRKELLEIIHKIKSYFKEMFYLLHKEYMALKEMYSPITAKLSNINEVETKLFDFYVKFEFDHQLMAEMGDDLIDHAKKGKYFQKDINAIKEEFNNITIDIEFIEEDNKQKFLELNETKIENFISNIETQLPDEQLKKNKSIKDYYDWLYSFNYYKLSYSIKFNDTDLNKLSPGLKGIALLILFLELDKEDYSPLLVDQPEENLDNRSVYETLRKYFIEAKKRRQIFLVTHNPNIVVNTDSEQVLVANYDPSKDRQLSNIYYVSGGLEHSKKLNKEEPVLLHQRGIKQHICHVLEGGEKAFKERERKYSIKEYDD